MNYDDVIVVYKNFDNNHPIINEVQFELVENTILKLIYNEDTEDIKICMSDSISENSELDGTLNINKINTLIKWLSNLKNQILQNDNWRY